MITGSAGRRAVLNPRNGDPYLLLIEVSHASFASTWRYTSNTEDVTSGGNTYTAFPFIVSLPVSDDGVARGTVEIANITTAIWRALDVGGSPPSVTVKFVLASDPDTVIDQWAGMELRRVTASFSVVEAEISHENYSQEPWPKQRLTPVRAPWMLYFDE